MQRPAIINSTKDSTKERENENNISLAPKAEAARGIILSRPEIFFLEAR